MRAPRATPARQPLATEVKKPGGRLRSVALSTSPVAWRRCRFPIPCHTTA